MTSSHTEMEVSKTLPAELLILIDDIDRERIRRARSPFPRNGGVITMSERDYLMLRNYIMQDGEA